MPTGFANPSLGSCQPVALHLAEEISHRVIDEYTEAIAILSSAASLMDVTAEPALRRAVDRLQAMAEAHRSLLVPITEEYIDLGHHVGTLCSSLSRASLSEQGIRLTVATDEIQLDPARCWRVGLIISELIRNAARHSLKDGRGSIRVTLNRNGSSVSCVVCDNGCPASDLSEGRGRRLIRGLTAELGGIVEWKFTQCGSFAGVRFPVITP
ncbi:sensor histidine kinase [Mesorhizobium sp. M0166]|uniref:sensor histidine kinase n=1 Tax=Mesorhizobium sp. M0166 TaxID=2956902 RepID=UPI00333D4204